VDEARPLVQVSALSLLQCLTLMADGGKDIWCIKNDACMYVPFVFRTYTVSKNVPRLTCYDIVIHDPIKIVFGRSVTKKVRNQTMVCFPTSSV